MNDLERAYEIAYTMSRDLFISAASESNPCIMHKCVDPVMVYDIQDVFDQHELLSGINDNVITLKDFTDNEA